MKANKTWAQPISSKRAARSSRSALICHRLILVGLLLLAGCGGGQGSQTVPTRLPTTVSVLAAAVSPSATATITPLPSSTATSTPLPSPTDTPLPTTTPVPTVTPSLTPTATMTPTATPVPDGHVTIVGYSAQGRVIESYQFGNGSVQVLFVGGMHGGYEWNSILVAYEIIDHFLDHPGSVPPDVTIHVIPSANPDGQFLVTGREGRFLPEDVAANTIPGRFNGNNVDLNRNWPCNWSGTGLWRDIEVSGGSHPLSEPENIALRDFILRQRPAIVVFYHSAVNAIFTSGCPDTDPISRSLADVYGEKANYAVFELFGSYPVTGDAGDWLVTQGIPSFTVELSTHTALDWSRNLAGIEALLQFVAEDS